MAWDVPAPQGGASEQWSCWPFPSRGVKDSALTLHPAGAGLLQSPPFLTIHGRKVTFGYCLSLDVFDSCWSEICFLCALVNLRFFYVNGILRSCVHTLWVFIFSVSLKILSYTANIFCCAPFAFQLNLWWFWAYVSFYFL